MGTGVAPAALSGRADSRLAGGRNQHSRDESGLHHTAVARALDGVRLVDPQGPRCAWRRENSTSRIFSPDGQRRYAADRDRAAIRHEHARRIARLPRPGVPRVHRGHDDSKDRDEFQLRLAGRAAAKRRAPLHRVPERHDLGPHPARGGPRPVGIRRTQSIRALAAGHGAARVDHGRVGRHRALCHRRRRIHLHVFVHSQYPCRVCALRSSAA